jgi:FimV-like protein
MINQQTLEQVKMYLEQGDYENAITLLEECITESPGELTYSWYLGLAYLLEEQEEKAQDLWLSLFLEGSLEEVEQWMTELTIFLESEIQNNIEANLNY